MGKKNQRGKKRPASKPKQDSLKPQFSKGKVQSGVKHTEHPGDLNDTDTKQQATKYAFAGSTESPSSGLDSSNLSSEHIDVSLSGTGEVTSNIVSPLGSATFLGHSAQTESGKAVVNAAESMEQLIPEMEDTNVKTASNCNIDCDALLTDYTTSGGLDISVSQTNLSEIAEVDQIAQEIADEVELWAVSELAGPNDRGFAPASEVTLETHRTQAESVNDVLVNANKVSTETSTLIVSEETNELKESATTNLNYLLRESNAPDTNTARDDSSKFSVNVESVNEFEEAMYGDHRGQEEVNVAEELVDRKQSLEITGAFAYRYERSSEKANFETLHPVKQQSALELDSATTLDGTISFEPTLEPSESAQVVDAQHSVETSFENDTPKQQSATSNTHIRSTAQTIDYCDPEELLFDAIVGENMKNSYTYDSPRNLDSVIRDVAVSSAQESKNVEKDFEETKMRELSEQSVAANLKVERHVHEILTQHSVDEDEGFFNTLGQQGKMEPVQKAVRLSLVLNDDDYLDEDDVDQQPSYEQGASASSVSKSPSSVQQHVLKSQTSLAFLDNETDLLPEDESASFTDQKPVVSGPSQQELDESFTFHTETTGFDLPTEIIPKHVKHSAPKVIYPAIVKPPVAAADINRQSSSIQSKNKPLKPSAIIKPSSFIRNRVPSNVTVPPVKPAMVTPPQNPYASADSKPVQSSTAAKYVPVKLAAPVQPAFAPASDYMHSVPDSGISGHGAMAAATSSRYASSMHQPSAATPPIPRPPLQMKPVPINRGSDADSFGFPGLGTLPPTRSKPRQQQKHSSAASLQETFTVESPLQAHQGPVPHNPYGPPKSSFSTRADQLSTKQDTNEICTPANAGRPPSSSNKTSQVISDQWSNSYPQRPQSTNVPVTRYASPATSHDQPAYAAMPVLSGHHGASKPPSMERPSAGADPFSPPVRGALQKEHMPGQQPAEVVSGWPLNELQDSAVGASTFAQHQFLSQYSQVAPIAYAPAGVPSPYAPQVPEFDISNTSPRQSQEPKEAYQRQPSPLSYAFEESQAQVESQFDSVISPPLGRPRTPSEPSHNDSGRSQGHRSKTINQPLSSPSHNKTRGQRETFSVSPRRHTQTGVIKPNVLGAHATAGTRVGARTPVNPYAFGSRGVQKISSNPYDPQSVPLTRQNSTTFGQTSELHLSRPPSELRDIETTLNGPSSLMTGHSKVQRIASPSASPRRSTADANTGIIDPHKDAMSRQRPLFAFGPKHYVVAIPPQVSYGVFSANVDIRVEELQTIKFRIPSAALEQYPGPLLSSKGIPLPAKRKEVDKYISTRIEELVGPSTAKILDQLEPSQSPPKVLLYRTIQILLRQDENELFLLRKLVAPHCTVGGERKLSSGVDMYLRTKHTRTEENDSQSTDAMMVLLSELESGNREAALQGALDAQQWAHALIIAYSLGKDQWTAAVAQFVREATRTPGDIISPLAFLYRVFSGAGAAAARELLPPPDANYTEKEVLARWPAYVAIVLANRTSDASETFAELGRLLVANGDFEAGHFCMILSGLPLFGVQQGIHLPLTHNQLIRDFDSLILAELYEYVLLLRSEAQHPFFHLLPFKPFLATMFADYSYSSIGARIAETAGTIARSVKASPAVLELCKQASERCTTASDGDGGHWLTRKLSRTKLDKTIVSSFNKFVSGETTIEEEPQKDYFRPMRPASAGPAVTMGGDLSRPMSADPTSYKSSLNSGMHTPGAQSVRMASPAISPAHCTPAPAPALPSSRAISGRKPPAVMQPYMPIPSPNMMTLEQEPARPPSQPVYNGPPEPAMPTEMIRHDEPTEEDDLGIGNSKPKEPVHSEKKEEIEEKSKKKGWFSWFRHGEDEPKAIKAKLGEENTFYYDKELKRWLNKNGPVSEAAAPPPPPKSSMPSHGPSTPANTAPPGSTQPAGMHASSIPSVPGAPPVSSLPSSSSRTTNDDIDALLSVPSTGTRRKRNARNRYVDIMSMDNGA